MSKRKMTAILVAGALLCLNLNTAIPAQMEKRPVLAVIPLHAVDVTEIEVRQVTLHVIDHMKRAGLFIVLDIAHIENLLQDLGHGMSTRMDMETAIRAGKMLSADKVIMGTLEQEDGTYVVNLEMIDIAAGRVEGKSVVQSRLSFQELPSAMSALLDPLIHPESGQADIETSDLQKNADEVSWEAYSKLGTEEALTLYISSYPSGKYVSEARQKIKALQDAVQRHTGESVLAQEMEKKSESPVAEAGRTWREPGTGMEFVWIPPGEFMMGSNAGVNDEKPVHRVRITKGFWMGKYEVTQEQWREVMGSNPSYFPIGDNYPVEGVSWINIQSFIQKLNQLTGKTFRLPTEAEWEYACRAGTTWERYDSSLNSIAWYSSNPGRSTQPVGRKQPNAFGLYDMLGNVWEWVQDRYGSDYNSRSQVDDPQGPTSGSYRVFRGGSWNNNARYVRAASRNSSQPQRGKNDIGFRLARTD